MTLKELGELLRRERERKGLSVKQVMESTKISRRILVAIEDGDRANLPHPVYAKGFIRNYARLLDLTQEELLAAVDQEFGVEEDEERQHTRSVPRRAAPADGMSAQPANGRRVWPTLLLIAVLVAVLAAMVVYLQRRGALTAQGPAAPQVQEQAAAPATAPEAAAVQPAPAPEPVAPVVETPAPAPAPVSPAAPAAPVQEQAKPAVPAQEQAKPHVPGAKTLAVVAKPGQMCWMEVSVDGGDKKEFFIRSNESVSFEYTEKLWIKLGNVGGVNVTHNGKAVVTDGAGWSVKTLTFP